MSLTLDQSIQLNTCKFKSGPFHVGNNVAYYPPPLSFLLPFFNNNNNNTVVQGLICGLWYIGLYVLYLSLQ